MMKRRDVNFIENLKKLRKSKNLSQAKLAEELHTTQQNIQKYENDMSGPSIEMLKQMADFFHTSVDYIIGYSDISSLLVEHQIGRLTNEELELLTTYRSIDESQKEVVQIVAKSYTHKK